MTGSARYALSYQVGDEIWEKRYLNFGRAVALCFPEPWQGKIVNIHKTVSLQEGV